MLRIGLTGHARTGKDTAADYISRKMNLKHINFADELKKDLIALDPIIDPFSGAYLSDVLNTVETLERVKDLFPEWRRLCQLYGTEVRRAKEPNIWIDRLVDAVYEEIYREGRLWNGFVVGDVRFPNERTEILWNATIRVIRPGHGPANDHEAESYIDTMEVDYEILNDGSIEDFYRKVDNVIELIDRSRDDEEEHEGQSA